MIVNTQLCVFLSSNCALVCLFLFLSARISKVALAKLCPGFLQMNSASYIFGLAIVFFAGICFALFSPAFNLATNDQWHYLKPGVPHLVVYTAFFYFSCAAFAFGFGINLIFLYRPMLGLPKSTISAWLRDGRGRWWAFLAGFLCSFGNGFQFMGGEAAGYAAADAVQVGPGSLNPNHVTEYSFCFCMIWKRNNYTEFVHETRGELRGEDNSCTFHSLGIL